MNPCLATSDTLFSGTPGGISPPPGPGSFPTPLPLHGDVFCVSFVKNHVPFSGIVQFFPGLAYFRIMRARKYVSLGLFGMRKRGCHGVWYGYGEKKGCFGTDSGCLDQMQVQGVYPPTLQSGDISDSITPSRGCFLSLFYKKSCLFFRNCSILPRFGVFPDNACPEICLFISLYAAEREGGM